VPPLATLPRFERDLTCLTPAQQQRFRGGVLSEFVPDLTSERGFRPGLRVKRVKRVKGTDHVFETTWAPNGRATWQYGPEVAKGEPHVIWRRIGTHDIFSPPPGP